MRVKARSILAAALAGLLTTSAQAATQLTMYYPVSVGGPLTKVVDKLVAGFEQTHPDIDINAIYAGNYDDARVKALSALKSGKPAQLSVMFSIDVHELMDQNAIVAFDDLVKTESDKKWLHSFYPGLMENGTVDGKVYGIPFQRSTIVMYYNKDAFRQAGLDPNKPPQTWDELVKDGQKLTQRDSEGKVKRWGVMIPSTGYPYWMFGALDKENGQVLMNSAGNKVNFDTPEAIEALSYWKNLSAQYHVMPAGIIDWGTLRQNFLQQKTAIMWHSTGNLTAVKKNANFDFGVAMLPKHTSFGSPTGGGNFYVFKQSTPEQRQAALQFIRYMTAPEQAAQWSIATGYMGVSPAAYQTPALKQYVAEFPPARVARDQLKYATAELSTHQSGRIRKLLDDAIQSVLNDQQQPAQALHQAQHQAERILRRYQ